MKICSIYYLVISVFAFLFISGCADREDLRLYRPEIEAPHEVEIVPEDETLVLSDLVDGYELIEPQGMLLSRIGEVFVYDSTWIVSGKSIENSFVNQFKKNGAFVRSILKVGKGPNEATSLFSIKMSGDDLYFLVDAGVKIIRYSMKERKFVESFMMPDEISAISDFAVLGNGKYILYKEHPQIQGDEYKLYVYDRAKDQIEQRWIPMQKQAWADYLWFGQTNSLYQLDDKFYFHEVFQRGIWEVNENGLKGYVSFKDNSYTMPDDGVYNSYPTLTEFLDYCKSSPYIWAHRSIYEGEHFILSSFMYNNTYHWNVIDKREWTSHSYTKIKDNVLLDTEMSLADYLYQESVQGDVRYFRLSYDLLQRVMEQKKANGELDAYARKHPDVMELYKTMNEDSNDLIVVFHEKQ